MASNVLVIGGSRHIGYYAALRFLDAGAAVTFLLRSPVVFDNDDAVQKYVKSGTARLVKGDALVVEDIHNVWAEASKEAPVNLLLFTVGFTGNPSFHPVKGFMISPPNLVTQCLLNVLCSMPKGQTPSASSHPLPKIITLSTSGVSRSSRAKAPLLLKPIYGYLIQSPLQDKLASERVVYYCAGWKWNAEDGDSPGELDAILGPRKEWIEREGLPAPGTLKDCAMVLRAAMLNDGECRADLTGSDGKRKKAKPAYRAGEGEVGGYSISRKDVAHFIFDAVTNHWEEYGGKQISIAY